MSASLNRFRCLKISSLPCPESRQECREEASSLLSGWNSADLDEWLRIGVIGGMIGLFDFSSFRRAWGGNRRGGLRGSIRAFVSITGGKVHDVNVLGEILPEARAGWARKAPRVALRGVAPGKIVAVHNSVIKRRVGLLPHWQSDFT
jgi:hypothetical protein